MTTFLVVDDHPTFRKTARTLLESEGFEVVGEAVDGASAIEAVRMTLVPAFLTMLGEKAWYMPRWLDRFLPNIRIEPPQDGEAPPKFTEQPVQVPSRP